MGSVGAKVSFVRLALWNEGVVESYCICLLKLLMKTQKSDANLCSTLCATFCSFPFVSSTRQTLECCRRKVLACSWSPASRKITWFDW